jgi:hypothetical protein
MDRGLSEEVREKQREERSREMVGLGQLEANPTAPRAGIPPPLTHTVPSAPD